MFDKTVYNTLTCLTAAYEHQNSVPLGLKLPWLAVLCDVIIWYQVKLHKLKQHDQAVCWW